MLFISESLLEGGDQIGEATLQEGEVINTEGSSPEELFDKLRNGNIDLASFLTDYQRIEDNLKGTSLTAQSLINLKAKLNLKVSSYQDRLTA